MDLVHVLPWALFARASAGGLAHSRPLSAGHRGSGSESERKLRDTSPPSSSAVGAISKRCEDCPGSLTNCEHCFLPSRQCAGGSIVSAYLPTEVLPLRRAESTRCLPRCGTAQPAPELDHNVFRDSESTHAAGLTGLGSGFSVVFRLLPSKELETAPQNTLACVLPSDPYGRVHVYSRAPPRAAQEKKAQRPVFVQSLFKKPHLCCRALASQILESASPLVLPLAPCGIVRNVSASVAWEAWQRGNAIYGNY